MTTGRISGNAYPHEGKDTWWYQFYLPTELSPTGKRKPVKRHKDRVTGEHWRTKKAALRAMDDHIAGVKNGTISVLTAKGSPLAPLNPLTGIANAFSLSMTFEQFFTLWLKKAEEEWGKSQNYLAKVKATISTYALPWLKDVRLENIRDRSISLFKILRDSGGHRGCCYDRRAMKMRPDSDRTSHAGKPLGRGTVSNVHFSMNAILEVLEEEKLFPAHPLHKVKLPADGFKADKENKPWVAEDAVHAVHVVFPRIKNGLAYTLAIMTGMRRGEVTGLKWDAVDFEKRLISVRLQRTHVPGIGTVDKAPKYDSFRIIKMPEIIYTLLCIHRKNQEVTCAKNGWSPREYVFVTLTGKPFGGCYFSKHFNKIVKASGLPKSRFHDMRHAYATITRAKGGRLEDIQDTLGHSSIQSTQLYAGDSPETRDRTGALTDAIFAPAA